MREFIHKKNNLLEKKSIIFFVKEVINNKNIFQSHVIIQSFHKTNIMLFNSGKTILYLVMVA